MAASELLYAPRHVFCQVNNPVTQTPGMGMPRHRRNLNLYFNSVLFLECGGLATLLRCAISRRYNRAAYFTFGGFVKLIDGKRVRALLALGVGGFVGCTALWAQGGAAQSSPAGLPSEMPARIEPVTSSFDYLRREVMIPMRDGVKLHTVILVPKGAKGAGILLTRTPYDADSQTNRAASAHLGPTLSGYDNATEVIVEGGYIRVVQDVRGKYGSEGDYVMTRPLHGPLNPTPVDHSTDTYDTIDWLVKNVPESNGRVGILGISYDGFLPLMALVNPHPALKVAVPMNPMVDGWMGDDWFHNGAFREQNMPYIYEQEATRTTRP